jgi:ABC-2 type transport system ATP-binding protein
VDDKAAMMERLGRTEAVIELTEPLTALPDAIAAFPVELRANGRELIYRGGDGTGKGRQEIADLTKALTRANIDYRGIDIHDSSLEDIFVGLLHDQEAA